MHEARPMSSRLNLVAALGFGVALLAPGGAMASDDAGCWDAPGVAVLGDAGPSLREALAEVGVVTTEREDVCARVSLTLSHLGGTLLLAMNDREGANDRRRVADIATAVNLAEMWIDTELTAPLLASRSVHLDTSESRSVLLAPEAETVFAIDAVGLIGFGGDESLWSGARVGACIGVGPLCVGGEFTASADVAALGASATEPYARTAIGVMGAAHLPIAWPGVTLTPGLGVGMHWLGATYQTEEGPENVDDGGVVIGASVKVAVALAEGLFFQTTAWFDAMPMARAGALVDDEGDYTIPGDPLWTAGLGLGLRYAVDP